MLSLFNAMFLLAYEKTCRQGMEVYFQEEGGLSL